MDKNIVVLGSSGALGGAFVSRLASAHPESKVFAFSRSVTSFPFDNVHSAVLDYYDESQLADAAQMAAGEQGIDLALVATGFLHDDSIAPEKSLKDLSFDQFETLFRINSAMPAMAAKHLLPRLNKNTQAKFAAISARVGSVSDNRLGGWYAYRASKAALNMLIRCAAIETSRRHPQSVVVGLHPGTVDSDLSKPFQKRVPDKKLFTPDFSAEKMLSVLDSLTPEHTGKVFAWDGLEVQP